MHEEIPPYFNPLRVENGADSLEPSLSRMLSASYMFARSLITHSGTSISLSISHTKFLGQESYAFFISKNATTYLECSLATYS